MRLRVAVTWFLLGAVVGGVVAGPSAVLLAWEVKRHDPGLAARAGALLPGAAGPVASAPVGDLGDVTVTASVDAGGRPISPWIYGVANAGTTQLRTLGATADRWGGDNQERYNWVLGNAWNATRDYLFENGDYGFADSSPSSAADSFIDAARAAGADPLVTIPALGWVAKNSDSSVRSVGVPALGGSPLTPGGTAIAGYDPAQNQALTSVPSGAVDPGNVSAPPSSAGAVYQNQWVHFLQQRYGAGGVRFYAIGNEPDLWCEIDTDVHPACMSYQETLGTFESYASAVRAQAPRAQILGPVVSGWDGIEFSSLDRGGDNFATHADRQAHGGQPFLPWWLDQVHRFDQSHGVRTLDVLDVHWYPQEPGVYSAAADPSTAALRIQSVRSLWDPTYTDQSWINQRVDLIPRLEGWVRQYYPGTKVGISEYNFGGERSASGAIALAEALGTFGVEGLYLADYWSYPPLGSPAAAAFELYRNYDAHGSTFGTTSVPVHVDQAGVRAYAAVHREAGRQHGQEDVILTNESPGQTATVHLHLGSAATGTLYLVPPGSGAIHVESGISLSNLHLPPASVALVVAG